MVRHRPLGVGLGDWQTFYPIYRLHDPQRSFSADYQVRRAHSDHVQVLGEAGWPGLALWLAFLATTVWMTTRSYLTTHRWEPFFIAGQLVAFVVAMGSDYVIEQPFHKAQFLLVVFLALATIPSRAVSRSPRGSRGFLAVAIAVTLVAVCQIAFHVGLNRRIHQAARLEQSYSDTLRLSPATGGGISSEACVRTFGLGMRFISMYGHTKTFHKDWLIVAHCAQQLGHRELALAATQKTLDLHPFYPAAHLMMSRLVDVPEESQRWARSYQRLLEGPSHELDL